MNRSSTEDQATEQGTGPDDGRVLPFRRRGALFTRNPPRPPALPDLAEYERTPNEPDDYRHRMIMNGIAFVATVSLVLAGIWIAEVMAHMRKDQDCVLMGRSNCAHLEVPAQQR